MNRLINAVPKLKILKQRNNPFLTNIKKAVDYAENVLKEIKNTFDNYTNHDINHSFSVIKYMLDAVTDINKLSDLELTVIIYAGLFHDIGMVVTDDEKTDIKNNKYGLSPYNYSCVLENCSKNEYLAMQEIIRPIHALRSKEHILEKMTSQRSIFEVVGMNGIYFDEMLAEICVAHNEEFEWVKLNLQNDIKLGKYTVNAQYIAILLRIGDLLDIDSSRTPDYLYNLISPKGISDTEWRQQFVISNSEKIVDTANGIKVIEFYGTTEDAKIHRKILNYIDWIKKELENAADFLNQSVYEKYHLNISTNIRNCIKPKNFEFSNLKLSLEYNSITNLLMGENIYNNKRCGLREIIQNSIDACQLMKEEAKNLEAYKYNAYVPKIVIRIDENKKSVSIFDNGIGMSFDIIKKYFLNVGVSYYSSNDCRYRGYSYTPIGNYGIGFLACFMLSDTVKIKTKRFDSRDTYVVDVEKNNEYVIFNKVLDNAISFTEITLDKMFFEVFNSVDDIKSYIEKTFLADGIDIIIQIIDKNGKCLDVKCDLMAFDLDKDDKICISKYLDGIEAYASINKKVRFIDSLHYLSGNNYIYINGELLKYDSNTHNIDDLIYDNELNYVTATLITKSLQEKLDSFYEALDDYEEAVEKLNDIEELEKINVYYNAGEIGFIGEGYYCDIVSADLVELFDDGFTAYDLLSLFDSDDLLDTDLSAIYTSGNQCSIVSIGENKYLMFDKDKYLRWLGDEKRYLFVRNVLISRYDLTIPTVASGIRINNITVNVLNKSVIPDISRTDIQEGVSKKINYAIGKAVHLWIYDNGELLAEEKGVLKQFINLNYSKNNEFMASEYKNLIR